MKFQLNNSVQHLLILGAGASKEYGLPVWKELTQLIKDKVNFNKDGQYEYQKEILEWIEKMIEKKEYGTLDECIAKESDKYHFGGDKIENQIFLIVKEILNDKYEDNYNGWIKLLNEKILHNINLEYQIAFINYNYDNVLSRNFLKFEHLSDKKRNLTHQVRLRSLSEVVVGVLHPHGYISHDKKIDPQLYIQSDTIKSNNNRYVDMISCHDGKDHSVYKANLASGIKLYFLGLGGGLQFNLTKMNFENPVSEIHVTIQDISKKDEIVDFLSKKFRKLKVDIKIYSDCAELIEKCF